MISDENPVNPYAPPKSSVADAAATTTGRFYSPWQICVAALLGGPLAAGYFYWRNHILFGSPNKARTSLLWTGAVLVCSFVIGLLLPKQTSGTAIAVGVAVGYRVYARKAFDETISTRRNEGWTRYSWWRALGLSLVGLILTMAILMGVVSLLPERWTENL